MSLSQLVPQSAIGDRLKVLRVITFKDQYIVVSYRTGKGDSLAVKTSIVHIDMKTKKLVQLSYEQMNMEYEAETIACLSFGEQDSMLQVCPKSICLAKSSEPRTLLKRLDLDDHRVEGAAIDPKT